MKRIIAIVVVVTFLASAVVAMIAGNFLIGGAGYAGGFAGNVQQPYMDGDGAMPVANSNPPAVGRSAEEAPVELAYEQAQTDYFAEPEQQKRLVIKNADLSIVVKDPAAKMQEIKTLAEQLGGYVVSLNTSQSYLSDGTKVPEGYISIRVPQENLSQALETIKTDVVEVQTDTLSGQDVTKEYTDLSSQLKNLQATEKKLTEIMDKAEKTEDVLAVFNQLTQIRGQIEVIVGQMKYYEQSAALSAINVRVVAERTIQPIEIAGWQPQGQARDAAQALVNFFQGFVNFLIWLVIFFLPILIVLLLLGLLLWRLGRWGWQRFFAKQ